MKIKTIIEQKDGNYEFNAELTKEQHAFLIEFAIRELIKAGLIPFADTTNTNATVVLPTEPVPMQ